MELFDGVYLVGSGEFGISDAYDCHVYLVDGGDDAVLIDSGAGRDGGRIMENIGRRMPPERVSRVLLTHTHADHSGGAPYFQSKGIKVIAPEGEMEFMRRRPDDVLEAFRRARRDGSYPEGYEYPFIEPDGIVRDGDVVQVGRASLRAIHTKGHSDGLLCYLLEMGGRRILFSGDYIFFNGRIGLLNCPGSDLGDYRREIGKLADLAIDALLPGHRMLALGGGQRHIAMAIDSLSRAFVPSMF